MEQKITPQQPVTEESIYAARLAESLQRELARNTVVAKVVEVKPVSEEV